MKVYLIVLTLVISVFAETYTDSRDGRLYHSQKVGYTEWMVENLNYKAPGSYCYDNDEKNCETLGRLYTWNSAADACPDGWTLPSEEDWKTLLDSSGSWMNLRKLGIELPLAGDRRSDGIYHYNGSSAFYWTATESGQNAVRFKFEKGVAGVNRSDMARAPGYSVKCIRGGKNCNSPFFKAVRSGDVRKVKKFLDQGLNPSSQCYTENPADMSSFGMDYEGISPLSYAIDQKNVDLIRLLLEYGADPNAVDVSGPSEEQFSILIRASVRNNFEIVKLIMEKKKEVYFCDMSLSDVADERILLYLVDFVPDKQLHLCEYGRSLLDMFEDKPAIAKKLKARGVKKGATYCNTGDDEPNFEFFTICGD